MADCMQFALKYVEDLKDDSLKDKEVGCVFDLLKNLKTLLRRCSIPDTASNVDTLRLNTTLRMFNIPHFNAKMNALKEVQYVVIDLLLSTLLLYHVCTCTCMYVKCVIG